MIGQIWHWLTHHHTWVIKEEGVVTKRSYKPWFWNEDGSPRENLDHVGRWYVSKCEECGKLKREVFDLTG